MKCRIYLLLFFCGAAFQCSEPLTPRAEFKNGLTPEEMEYVQNISKRLIALSSFSLKKSGTKMLFEKIVLLTLLEDIGNSVYSEDKEGKNAFNYLMASSEMQKLVSWAGEFPKRSEASQGNRNKDEYDPIDLLSASSKDQVTLLKQAMTNCINTYYYETDYLLNVLLGEK